jgi:hypothetical protein
MGQLRRRYADQVGSSIGQLHLPAPRISSSHGSQIQDVRPGLRGVDGDVVQYWSFVFEKRGDQHRRAGCSDVASVVVMGKSLQVVLVALRHGSETDILSSLGVKTPTERMIKLVLRETTNTKFELHITYAIQIDMYSINQSTTTRLRRTCPVSMQRTIFGLHTRVPLRSTIS